MMSLDMPDLTSHFMSEPSIEYVEKKSSHAAANLAQSHCTGQISQFARAKSMSSWPA